MLNEELEDNAMFGSKEPPGEAHISAHVLSGVVKIPTESVENNHQAEESMFESGAMAESVGNETSDASGREDSDLNIDRPCELEHDSCVLSHPLSDTDSESRPDTAEGLAEPPINWAVHFNITHTPLSALPEILRPNFRFLPKDLKGPAWDGQKLQYEGCCRYHQIVVADAILKKAQGNSKVYS